MSKRKEKEWQIEGKIDRSGKREIRVDGGRRRPDRVGLAVEWSGLVVGGGQIGNVEQEREQDQCVENELSLGWVENKIDFGWWQSGWQRWWASSGDYDGDSLSLSLSTFLVCKIFLEGKTTIKLILQVRGGILRSKCKIFLVWPYFQLVLNTHNGVKYFLKLVFMWNKCNLRVL